MSKRTPLAVRPPLARSGPNRTAGNLYRAAVDDPHAIGGVPLDSVESTVTAAVRLGYKIASAQIDRSSRIARRFRDAADRATGVERGAGGSSEKETLDATEQLIFKGIMAALGWFEGVASDNSNPLRRIAAAQFQMVGRMLGLTPGTDVPMTDARRRDGHRATTDAPARTASPPGPPRSRRRLPRIQHDPKIRAQQRRVVQIQGWDLATEAVGDYEVTFYFDGPATGTFDGTLNVTRTGQATLTVGTTAEAASGLYKAAVCDDKGLQLGYLEVLL